MYKLIATLAFIFIVLAAVAQNRRLVDSLNQVIKEAKTDTGRIRPLIALAEYYIDQSGAGNRLDSTDFLIKQSAWLNKKYHVAEFQNHMNILSVDEHFQRHPGGDAKAAFLPLVANCAKTGDKKNESLAWIYLAFYTPVDEASNPFRLTCFEHIVSLSRQINDGKTEMEYRKSIADIHFQQQKYALAENELLQITKDGKRAGPANIMRTYDLLTAVYITKGEYNNALSYALKTINTMQMIGDSSSVMTFYERLISIYNTLGKFLLSEEFARKALAHAIKYNEHEDVFYRSYSIVDALIRQRKASEALKFIISITAKHKPTELSELRYVQKCFGDCYYALKKYVLAERSYLEMIRFGTRKTENGGTAYSTDDYFTLINFYIERQEYTKAQKYLHYVLAAYANGGTVEDLKNVYLSLFMVDSARGDFPAAIKDLRQHVKLKDSIFSIAKNKQIEELQVTYQIKEREKDLKLERNRANLAQVNLQHSQNTRNWIMAGSALLFIIAGLLYRQNGQKQKSNAIITHKNELLQKLVEEKEWLLKEVHHRVKNNLHSVICLLESQAAYLENDALKAIEESQHRIYTMSLIHQKLYQSEDVKAIDMSVYIPELVQYLSESFDTSNYINFDLMIEPINLNASQAIPLALIINEALTNSIKYAFPGHNRGEITISLSDIGDQYKLVLSDNGIGMHHNSEDYQDSLGMQLMSGLTEEISGTISIENNNGVKITIVFEHDVLNNIETLNVGNLTSAEL